jgi:hypothetical protein
MIFNREPVAALAVIQTAVAIFVAFGLKISAEQVGAVTALSAAVLGFIARSRVTPVEV